MVYPEKISNRRSRGRKGSVGNVHDWMKDRKGSLGNVYDWRSLIKGLKDVSFDDLKLMKPKVLYVDLSDTNQNTTRM